MNSAQNKGKYPPPSAFLPTSRKEVEARGWDQLDVILFSGDAYVDHPSFGVAVIGRVLEAQGWKVAIVPQPNWRDDLRDFKKLGRPRLFFGVSGGCMDSMVNHYTANKRLRSDDAYTAGGLAGQRPDRAVTVYSRALKELYPDIPLILGGIEASLRRLTHYDYWSDSLKPSILVESGADLLVYGAGELPICEIARRLDAGERIENLKNVPQTAFSTGGAAVIEAKKIRELASFEDCQSDKRKFADNFRIIEEESNRMEAATLIEPVGDQKIVINPSLRRIDTATLDSFYELPYTRLPHPRYKDKRLPAYEMIRHSITLHRGCFGACSFCTISAHQGKFIVERSEASILREVDRVVEMPDFAGNISDIGGPSANMYGLRGKNEDICRQCRRPSCLHPRLCRNLDTDLSRLTALYKQVLANPKVKRAFVGSGIRYDIFLDEKTGDFRSASGQAYFEQLVRHHVSGRLKVAPEHSAEHILRHIRKPSFALFEAFKSAFDDINKRENLRQQLIPYFISSLPSCKESDMKDLSTNLKRLGYKLEQVQDFTPTPLTLDSAIYYSGLDPYTQKPVFVEKSPEAKLRQRSYFFAQKPIKNQQGRGAFRASKKFKKS